MSIFNLLHSDIHLFNASSTVLFVTFHSSSSYYVKLIFEGLIFQSLKMQRTPRVKMSGNKKFKPKTASLYAQKRLKDEPKDILRLSVPLTSNSLYSSLGHLRSQ